jgi:hypothetical protein
MIGKLEQERMLPNQAYATVRYEYMLKGALDDRDEEKKHGRDTIVGKVNA